MIKLISLAVTGLGAVVLLSFLLSLPVWLLWNGCLVDAVTGVNEITWLQAWGISILCGFLFKSHSTTSESK
jgi:putative flippase GtrA